MNRELSASLAGCGALWYLSGVARVPGFWQARIQAASMGHL